MGSKIAIGAVLTAVLLALITNRLAADVNLAFSSAIGLVLLAVAWNAERAARRIEGKLETSTPATRTWHPNEAIAITAVTLPLPVRIAVFFVVPCLLPWCVDLHLAIQIAASLTVFFFGLALFRATPAREFRIDEHGLDFSRDGKPVRVDFRSVTETRSGDAAPPWNHSLIVRFGNGKEEWIAESPDLLGEIAERIRKQSALDTTGWASRDSFPLLHQAHVVLPFGLVLLDLGLFLLLLAAFAYADSLSHSRSFAVAGLAALTLAAASGHARLLARISHLNAADVWASELASPRYRLAGSTRTSSAR